MKLPRVHRITSRGRVYKYHRVTRAELPNDVPEDHPTFIAAWTAEEGRKSAPPKRSRATAGTIAAGCEEFLRSGALREVSDGYREILRRHIEPIREKYGGGRMADLRAYHIAADLDPLTPSVASHRLKTWRKLCAFWHDQGAIPADISQQTKAKRIPKTDGHREWLQEHVDAFRDHWAIGTPQRLALELLQWTGARSGDAVRLGPGMINRAGLLVFTQSKTKAEAVVPWTTPLVDMPHLAAQRTDLLKLTAGHDHMVFLVTMYGKPRSPKAFSSWFSEAATKAGLPKELSAHGLRKYRLNTLCEGGASVLQMQAWCGHLTLDEIELYTKRAQRRSAFLGTERKQNAVKQS